MTGEHKSSVALMRESIRLEHEAAERGLTAYAQISRHDFITARMEAMHRNFEQLRELVGEQEAVELLIQTVWSKEEIEAASGRGLYDCRLSPPH